MVETGLRDTSLRVQTPEGIEYALYPAGLPVRLCAAAIDQLFLGLILIAFALIYGLVLGKMLGFWFIMLARFVLDWFYHVFWELLFRGQSPGKKFLGLRVVCSDGSPVDPGSSLLRNLIRFIDSFLGLYAISFLSITASKGFRRLGDWAADTLVIHTWQSQAPERRETMSWLAGIAPVAPPPLSYEEKQGILMFARRFPVLGSARAGEIAGPLAAVLQKTGTGAATAEPMASAEYLLGIARSLEAP
jgi:uncharacterized RDD family membrane protein YckC